MTRLFEEVLREASQLDLKIEELASSFVREFKDLLYANADPHKIKTLVADELTVWATEGLDKIDCRDMADNLSQSYFNYDYRRGHSRWMTLLKMLEDFYNSLSFKYT